MTYFIRQMLYSYAILSFSIFLLSCFGLVSQVSLVACTIIALIALYYLCQRDSVVSSDHLLAIKKSISSKWAIGYLILFCIYLILSLRTPAFIIDDLVYHLQVPKMILENSGFVFDAHNINSNFPMLFEMPLLLVLEFFDFLNPSIISCLMGIGIILVLRDLGLSNFKLSEPVLFALSLCLVTTPVFFKSILCSYVELFMTLLFLLAIERYLSFQKDRSQGKYWFSVMVLMGLICGVKYLGLLYFFLFCVYEFFQKNDKRKYYSGVLIGLICAVPWYAKNYLYTGNPIFPLFHFYENPYISIDRLNIYSSLYKDFHMGREILDYILLPIRILIAPDIEVTGGQLGFGGKMSFLFIFSFISLCQWKNKYGLISFIAAIYFVFWALSSQQVRFLLPVFIPALLVGLSTFNKFGQKISPLLIFLFSIVIFQNSVHLGSYIKKEKLSDLYSFRENSDSFLSRRLPESFAFVKEVNEILNPKEDKVLSIGHFGKNYYFEIPVMTHTYYESEFLSMAFMKEKKNLSVLLGIYDQEKITHMMIDISRLEEFYEGQKAFDLPAMKQYLLAQKILLKKDSLLLLEVNLSFKQTY